MIRPQEIGMHVIYPPKCLSYYFIKLVNILMSFLAFFVYFANHFFHFGFLF